jgi:NADH dehydrogenase/NADH:ubiquinone oxidoreductase subunit G
MEKLVEIIVDGKNLAIPPNTTVLQALRDNDVNIPSLCWHPSLQACGSCGLCIVEVFNGKSWRARQSCLLKVKDGMQIKTATQRLKLMRSRAAQILLRRRPFHNKELEQLLLNLVQDENTEKQEDENLTRYIKDLSGNLTIGCIMCGLCIRICSKIGKHHLTYLGRGKNLRISFISGNDQDSCGNCRACNHVCPTGFITPNAREAFTAKTKCF